jgi:hypothetical protein
MASPSTPSVVGARSTSAKVGHADVPQPARAATEIFLTAALTHICWAGTSATGTLRRPGGSLRARHLLRRALPRTQRRDYRDYAAGEAVRKPSSTASAGGHQHGSGLEALAVLVSAAWTGAQARAAHRAGRLAARAGRAASRPLPARALPLRRLPDHQLDCQRGPRREAAL